MRLTDKLNQVRKEGIVSVEKTNDLISRNKLLSITNVFEAG